LNAEIPLGVMTSITGVSGSGKSSFMYEILYKNLQAKLERKYRTAEIFNCSGFSGSEYLSRAILIDQSPIGRTPIRELSLIFGICLLLPKMHVFVVGNQIDFLLM
jgi:excinuclease ABC subunit A